MQGPWLLLLFALCAVVIARAGFVLSQSADQLAQAYGWGRGWVGMALLATITSLPELASGVSAVACIGAPNLAVGNALGACLFNLAFLVVVDTVQRRQPMYREAGATHLLTAGFGVVMLGFVAFSLLAGQRVFQAHRLHLYQRLHQAGWPHARVAGLYIAATALLAMALLLAGWQGVVAGAVLELAVGVWLDRRVALPFPIASQNATV